jgi:hypothetical protein
MNIHEMTDQEILALDDTKIERIIKLKLAEEGLPMVAKPDEPKYFEIQPFDTVLFEVNGVDCLFTDEQTAIAVRDLLQNAFSKLRKTDGWHEDKRESQYYPSYDKSKTTLQVEKVDCYSRERYAQMQGMIDQNEASKDAYEKQLKEYEKARDNAEDFVSEIWNKVRAVREKYATFETMYGRYLEYLALADNQEERAWKFLKKAYGVDTETEQFIRTKLIERNSQSKQ